MKFLRLIGGSFCLHCKQDPIYVFPEMKLRGRTVTPVTISFVSNFRYSIFAVCRDPDPDSET
jgi:hypothetical protein